MIRTSQVMKQNVLTRPRHATSPNLSGEDQAFTRNARV
jgi:hypothetical protein